MKPFFKPEHFTVYAKEMTQGIDPLHPAERIAEHANQILEREGKVMFGYTSEPYGEIEFLQKELLGYGYPRSTHRALLINIEPIEKSESSENVIQAPKIPGQVYISKPGVYRIEELKCKHPVEKVSKVTQVLEHGLVNGPKTLHEWDKGYQCECGAKVKPKEFEAADD